MTSNSSARNITNMIKIINRIFNRLRSDLYLLFNKSRYGHVGSSVRIYSPLKVDGHENIFIGNNVRIGDKTWLAALPLTGDEARLEIGDGCLIGHFNHIYCTHSIKIENDVLTASFTVKTVYGEVNINV